MAQDTTALAHIRPPSGGGGGEDSGQQHNAKVFMLCTTFDKKDIKI